MEKENKEVKDKHIYGTEEDRKKALKNLKKQYQEHRIKYPEYLLQVKYIEKYWVVKEPENALNADAPVEGTVEPKLEDIVETAKPLDLSGAFGK